MDLPNRQLAHAGSCCLEALANLLGIIPRYAKILISFNGRPFNLTCHCINSVVWPCGLLLMTGAGFVKCPKLNGVMGSTSV